MAKLNTTQTVPQASEHRSPRRLSLSLASPACQYRTIASSSEAHKAVCSTTHVQLRTPNPHLPLGSTRSYTPLKVLGDGSFGTVWLCDWHGTLPPNTPLSPMQCGAGARPDWAGMRLVAVKRMKKQWEGGWDECQKNSELRVRISVMLQTSRSNQFPAL